MKIKSVTDVITNSSSEVFTLKTNKTKEEVFEWLKENVKWYKDHNKWYSNNPYPFTEPEVMTKDSGVLEWLIDFGYLYDSQNPEDVEKYKLQNCLHYANTDFYNDDYDFCIRKNGIIVRTAWIDFCENNMEELLTYFPEDYTAQDFWERFDLEEDWHYENLYPADGWSNKYNPFFKKFIEWYEKKYPNYIPKWWSIPECLDVNTYVGKIGFNSIDDNTIMYEDFEKILNEFGGEHWHMG